MDQSERLNTLIKHLGIDGKRLAEALSLTGSAISDWRSGKAPIRKPNCLALQALYGVSWSWLFDGEGPMWVSEAGGTGDAQDLVMIPHLEGDVEFAQSGEVTLPTNPRAFTPFARGFIKEMLLGCEAGSLSDLFIFECIGDAMRPTVHPGDMVLVNSALSIRTKPKRGAMFLVRKEPEGMDVRLKRVRVDGVNGKLCLASDSPGFAPIEVEIDGLPIQSLVLGRVCWIGRSVIVDERIDTNW